MGVLEEITKSIERLLSDEKELFLVDLVLKGTIGNQKLLVILDGDNGVNIDDCGRISRALGNFIEENNLIQERYFLEVSSAGLDHPIKLERQYKKNIGRTVKVKTTDLIEVEGLLLDSDKEMIKVRVEKVGDKVIMVKNIKETKILVEFK